MTDHRLQHHIDVDFAEVTHGQTFIYNASTKRWEFGSLSAGSGDRNVDGGTSSSVYLPSQNIDGGDST